MCIFIGFQSLRIPVKRCPPCHVYPMKQGRTNERGQYVKAHHGNKAWVIGNYKEKIRLIFSNFCIPEKGLAKEVSRGRREEYSFLTRNTNIQAFSLKCFLLKHESATLETFWEATTKSTPVPLLFQPGVSGPDRINPFYHLAACEGSLVDN